MLTSPVTIAVTGTAILRRLGLEGAKYSMIASIVLGGLATYFTINYPEGFEMATTYLVGLEATGGVAFLYDVLGKVKKGR